MTFSEIFWVFLSIFIGGGIAFGLHSFLSVSKKEAEEMGIVTPEMARDPEVIERLERETPISIRNSLEEAKAISRESEMSDKEVTPYGVVRKKRSN